MRRSDIRRDTNETKIRLALELDGTGKADIATGVGFLDHMLTLFARHGDFDLTVRCQGDTQVDGHLLPNGFNILSTSLNIFTINSIY